MPSPDISQYVDLTVYDKQPVDIQDEAVAYARTALPDWLPVTGSVEDALLQSTSYMTGVLGGAINRLPSGLFEGLLQLMKVTRYSGTPASASVTITTTTSFGHTIPSGTRLGFYDNVDPDNPILYTFDTLSELTIPLGQTVGSVAATAALTGQYPALISGTPLQVLTPTSFIQTAVLAQDIDPGSGSEDDATYFSRALSILNSYSSALVIPDQYEQHLLTTYSSVYRVKALSRVNAVNDDFADPLENGYLTIYACATNGASITPGVLASIADDLELRSVAGLSITVKHPAILPITAETTVTIKPGYVTSVVKAAVELSLNTYLHPDFWEWGQYIYYNEVISRIDQVEGVDRVVSLSIPAVAGLTDIGDNNRRFDKKGALPRVTPTVTAV